VAAGLFVCGAHGRGYFEEDRMKSDSTTLVRAAKPAPKKRDLPSKKPVKGGIKHN
jgi:hypothetical protein